MIVEGMDYPLDRCNLLLCYAIEYIVWLDWCGQIQIFEFSTFPEAIVKLLPLRFKYTDIRGLIINHAHLVVQRNLFINLYFKRSSSIHQYFQKIPKVAPDTFLVCKTVVDIIAGNFLNNSAHTPASNCSLFQD